MYTTRADIISARKLYDERVAEQVEKSVAHIMCLFVKNIASILETDPYKTGLCLQFKNTNNTNIFLRNDIQNEKYYIEKVFTVLQERLQEKYSEFRVVVGEQEGVVEVDLQWDEEISKGSSKSHTLNFFKEKTVQDNYAYT